MILFIEVTRELAKTTLHLNVSDIDSIGSTLNGAEIYTSKDPTHGFRVSESRLSVLDKIYKAEEEWHLRRAKILGVNHEN